MFMKVPLVKEKLGVKQQAQYITNYKIHEPGYTAYSYTSCDNNSIDKDP